MCIDEYWYPLLRTDLDGTLGCRKNNISDSRKLSKFPRPRMGGARQRDGDSAYLHHGGKRHGRRGERELFSATKYRGLNRIQTRVFVR